MTEYWNELSLVEAKRESRQIAKRSVDGWVIFHAGTVTFEDEVGRRYVVRLDVLDEEGRPVVGRRVVPGSVVVAEFSMATVPGRSITARSIAASNLGWIFREANAALMRSGRVYVRDLAPDHGPKDEHARQRKRGRPPTVLPAEIERAASLYLAAPVGQKQQAVADGLGVSVSVAGKRIMKARRMGHLA